jgi:hypothetical protein
MEILAAIAERLLPYSFPERLEWLYLAEETRQHLLLSAILDSLVEDAALCRSLSILYRMPTFDLQLFTDGDASLPLRRALDQGIFDGFNGINGGNGYHGETAKWYRCAKLTGAMVRARGLIPYLGET